MPIYQYKATDSDHSCQYCKVGIEAIQSMSDAPLTKCPHCQSPIKKVPSLCSGFSPMLSNSNLRDKGFTKFEKRGDGSYEKTT